MPIRPVRFLGFTRKEFSADGILVDAKRTKPLHVRETAARVSHAQTTRCESALGRGTSKLVESPSIILTVSMAIGDACQGEELDSKVKTAQMCEWSRGQSIWMAAAQHESECLTATGTVLPRSEACSR